MKIEESIGQTVYIARAGWKIGSVLITIELKPEHDKVFLLLSVPRINDAIRDAITFDHRFSVINFKISTEELHILAKFDVKIFDEMDVDTFQKDLKKGLEKKFSCCIETLTSFDKTITIKLKPKMGSKYLKE